MLRSKLIKKHFSFSTSCVYTFLGINLVNWMLLNTKCLPFLKNRGERQCVLFIFFKSCVKISCVISPKRAPSRLNYSHHNYGQLFIIEFISRAFATEKIRAHPWSTDCFHVKHSFVLCGNCEAELRYSFLSVNSKPDFDLTKLKTTRLSNTCAQTRPCVHAHEQSSPRPKMFFAISHVYRKRLHVFACMCIRRKCRCECCKAALWRLVLC